MNKVSFTPGPWLYEAPYIKAACPVASCECGGKVQVCEVFNEQIEAWPEWTALTEADSRLIAQAPALYEACSEMLVLVLRKYGLDPNVSAAIAKARAAIAKVEGVE